MEPGLLLLCIITGALAATIIGLLGQLLFVGNNKEEPEALSSSPQNTGKEKMSDKNRQKKSVKKPQYPMYKVRKNDTIQSVSELFGLDAAIWKKYHNDKCRLSHAIIDVLPENLVEIYLHPDLWNKEITLNQKKKETKVFPKLTDWIIYPRSMDLEKAYWFQYIIQEKNTRTGIRYKMLIRFIGEETESTSLYLIHRISNVYINDELPHLCMDELAYEAGKVLYPMIIEINEQAEWTRLRNYTQIKERWIREIRPYIALRYSGETVDNYLKKMNSVINSQSMLENVLKNELFFRFYFGTVYRNYWGDKNENAPTYINEDSIYFPLGNNFPSRFRVISRINRTPTVKGWQEIRQEGAGLSRPSENGETPLEDTQYIYTARFLLERRTNTINEAIAEWKAEKEQQNVSLILYPSRKPYPGKIDFKIDK